MTKEKYLSMRVTDPVGLLYTVYLEERQPEHLQFTENNFRHIIMMYPEMNVYLSILYDKYDSEFDVICVYDKTGKLIKAE